MELHYATVREEIQGGSTRAETKNTQPRALAKVISQCGHYIRQNLLQTFARYGMPFMLSAAAPYMEGCENKKEVVFSEQEGCLDEWYYLTADDQIKGPFRGYTDEGIRPGERRWCATSGMINISMHPSGTIKGCSSNAKVGDVEDGCATSAWHMVENVAKGGNLVQEVSGPFRGCISNERYFKDQLFCPRKIYYVEGGKYGTKWQPEPEKEEEKKVSKPQEPSPEAVLYADQNRNVVDYSNNTEVIYFPTDIDSLDPQDEKDIRTFTSIIGPKDKIIIEGFADSRGSEAYNLDLSRRRASSVKKKLRDSLSPDMRNRIRLAYFGESKAGADNLAEARHVTIVVGKHEIDRGLERLRADRYLIDASASMGGWEKWGAVVSHRYPKNAKKFVFGCRYFETNNFDEVFPDCFTPLWSSLYETVKGANNNNRITVLTDGAADPGQEENIPEIIKLAKRKGIEISFLAIGVDEEAMIDIRRVVRATGGKMYSIQ